MTSSSASSGRWGEEWRGRVGRPRVERWVLTTDVRLLLLIILLRILGTPDDDMWPKVSELPNYKTQFPKWKRQPLGRSVARLCPNGVDLLSVRAPWRQNEREKEKDINVLFLFQLN